MEQAMFPQNENNTPFDNEALFDAEGHLTDEGLHALQEGRLDELGSLETAEHLTFCDYCLARYTALIESAPEKLKQPMRDLIPQVQALMRLRSFRIMTNRYVSTAAVMLAFALWRFGFFGGVGMVQKPVQQLPDVTPRVTVSQALGGMFDSMSSGLSNMFDGMQLTINSGLAQLADPVVPHSNPTNNGGRPAPRRPMVNGLQASGTQSSPMRSAKGRTRLAVLLDTMVRRMPAARISSSHACTVGSST